MRNEAFLPSRHGFPCVLPPPEREDFGLDTPAPGAFGLSAGTVWVALDRFLAGRPLPELEPGASRDEVLRKAVRRQKDALARAGWLQLRDWQALPDWGVPGRKGVAERSRGEFRRLRQSLDDGTPVMLYLVLAQGRHADPSQNVAVLAYDYELDRRARRASVRVYDPARPGNDNVRLVFHAGADKAFDGRLAVQTAVRGFFCVPYDRPEPAALTLHGVGNEDARIETLLAVQGSAADASFEALGLGGEGQLLHVRRRRSGGYATEQIDVDVLDGCDVRQAAFVGSGRTVLWTSKGELIDCRRRPGLGWRARRITDTRTHGTFDGTATGVTRERGRVSLFACGTGRLMHFHRGRLPAWEAEHIDAGPLARAACTGTPAGVRVGSTMHVVARTRTGELVHARWRARGGWTAENMTARAGDRARFLVDSDPILLGDARARALNAVCRSRNGSVLLFQWTERKGWRAHDLSAAAPPALRETLRSESAISAAIEPDGTVHAVGRTARGGVLHAWCTREGTAGVHDLANSRPLIAGDARIDSAPTIIAGPADALHVLARRDAQLLLFRWAHNADWSVENVTIERDRPGMTGDVLVSAAGSVAHAALLDDDGRVHHAVLMPRGGTTRRLRLPTWLVDVLLLPLTITGILADAVSALIGLTKKGSAPRPAEANVASSDGVVARPREVPAAVLPRLPDETEESTPLPLLDEQVESSASNAVEATESTPSDAASPDEWSLDGAAHEGANSALAGPLDQLLNFGGVDATAHADASPVADGAAPAEVVTASGEEEPDVADVADMTDVDADVADVASVPPAAATDEAAPTEFATEIPAQPAPELPGDVTAVAAAVTAEDDAPASVQISHGADSAETGMAPAAAPDNGKQSDEAAVDEAERAADVAEPAHADVEAPPVSSEDGKDIEAAAADTELIVVYPEPEKRNRKARRGDGKRGDNAKKPDAKDRVARDENAAKSRPGDASASDAEPAIEDARQSDAEDTSRAAVKSRAENAADTRSQAENASDATPAPDNAQHPDTDEPPPESVDPLPLLDDGTPGDEAPTNAEPDEPWALPKFEVSSPADDWNAPDDEPWSVTPVEGLESTSKSPDTDGWNVPPVDGLEASEPVATDPEDDWNLPSVDGLEQDVLPDAADASPIADPLPAIDPVSSGGPRPPSIADTDDDWNLPDDAPAIVPEPVQAAESPSLDVTLPADAATESADDTASAAGAEQSDMPKSETPSEQAASAPAVEDNDQADRDAPDPALPGLTVIDAADDSHAPHENEPAAAAGPAAVTTPEPPRRKKWQNPALEGLPLLDDDDDDPPPAKPAQKPAAAPPAKKKPKKPSADEMERIIALAEANQPELLPPD